MQMTEKGKAQLISDEGRKNRLYKCTADKWTIGIGRNLQDKPISDAVIDLMFKEDVEEVINQLSEYEWFIECNDARRDVLINMGFMGVNRLLGFKKMIQALINKDYAGAAEQMLDSKWATQVGARANRLAKVMIEGRY